MECPDISNCGQRYEQHYCAGSEHAQRVHPICCGQSQQGSGRGLAHGQSNGYQQQCCGIKAYVQAIIGAPPPEVQHVSFVFVEHLIWCAIPYINGDA